MLLQTLVSNLFRHVKNNRISVNTKEVCWMVNILLALNCDKPTLCPFNLKIQMSYTNTFDD